MIKVLVVDGSNYMRNVITETIELDSALCVVGTAGSHGDAVTKIRELRPDVITLDTSLAGFNSSEVLDALMTDYSVGIIIFTDLKSAETEEEKKIGRSSQFALVEKPGGKISLNLESVKKELIEKIKNSVQQRRKEIRRAWEQKSMLFSSGPSEKSGGIVVIGSSTGGPKAVEMILEALPGDYGLGILIVQHMPKGYTRDFARQLNEKSELFVKEAEEGDFIAKGKAMVAPGNLDILLTNANRICLKPPKENADFSPSVDMTMQEAARNFGERAIGVILSGMGSDGVQGLKAIKAAGGYTIGQDEKSCVVFGMPKAAIMNGVIDMVAPASKIAKELISAARKVLA